METKYYIVLGVALVAVIVIWLVLRRGKGDSDIVSTHRDSTRIDPTTKVAKLNWLVGRAGSVDGKTYHIGTRTVTIGRGVSNFVQITDNAASRVHCQLVPLPYGLELKDMGSRNGTKVNGKRINEMSVLKDGDQLQIGEVILEYQRQATFRHNAGLERKESDTRAMKQTMMGNTMSVPELAQKAIDEHNGDLKAAAASMGITPELLVNMLEGKK